MCHFPCYGPSDHRNKDKEQKFSADLGQDDPGQRIAHLLRKPTTELRFSPARLTHSSDYSSLDQYTGLNRERSSFMEWVTLGRVNQLSECATCVIPPYGLYPRVYPFWDSLECSSVPNLEEIT
jgi:hypothetical protein